MKERTAKRFIHRNRWKIAAGIFKPSFKSRARKAHKVLNLQLPYQLTR